MIQPRLRLRSLMIAVVLSALLLAVARVNLPLALVLVFALLWIGLGIALARIRHPGYASLAFWLLVGVVNLGGVSLSLATVYLGLGVLSKILPFVLWIVTLSAIVGTGVSYVRSRPAFHEREQDPRPSTSVAEAVTRALRRFYERGKDRRDRAVNLVLLGGLLPLVTTFSQWPIHLAFSLSLPALNKAATDLRAGKSWNGPCWVGCFYIQRAAVNGSGVSLVTHSDLTGPCGFVHGPPQFTVNLNRGDWFQMVLGSGWEYREED